MNSIITFAMGLQLGFSFGMGFLALVSATRLTMYARRINMLKKENHHYEIKVLDLQNEIEGLKDEGKGE